MIKLLITGALALGPCAAITDALPTITTTDETPTTCPRTHYSAWDAIGPQPCDLDGSQTWILVDEMTDLPFTFDAAESICHDSGGIFTYHLTNPATAYCIDIDY
jgi:hypothetical protein